MDYPPNHTITARATCWRKSTELDTVRCALVGNSFQCGVVAWLIAHWAVHAGYLTSVPTVLEMRATGGGFTASELQVQFAKPDEAGPAVRRADLKAPAAAACPSVTLVEEMVRRSEVRGSDVRLDTLEVMRPDLWPRRPISVARWTWRAVVIWGWRQSGHITDLELRSALVSMRWRFRNVLHFHCRFAHLMDSQVGIGVVTRGRSSSSVLNCTIQRINSLLLAAGCRAIYGYTETDRNPADHPTRNDPPGAGLPPWPDG